MAYSKNLPKLGVSLEDYTSLSNIKSVIAVSDDKLALINSSDGSVKSLKDLTFLLDGKSGRYWILEADADIIQSIIDGCYNARENNETFQIITQDGRTIYFN